MQREIFEAAVTAALNLSCYAFLTGSAFLPNQSGLRSFYAFRGWLRVWSIALQVNR
jgi:hypothetical protein